MIVKYLFPHSFNTYYWLPVYTRHRAGLPHLSSFTKAIRICFYFVFLFINAMVSRKDQFMDLVSCLFVGNSNICIPNLGCSKGKRERIKKVSPHSAIIWTPVMWETKGVDKPRQLRANEPLPVHSSSTLCQNIWVFNFSLLETQNIVENSCLMN